jgi:hypothetical protein
MSRAWPKTKGSPAGVQRSASQVPGEAAFDADHHLLSRGDKRLETRFGCCPHMPVEHDLSILVYEAEVQGPGVQVDATVARVLCGVESPEVSSA